jgi:hypothetical protein
MDVRYAPGLPVCRSVSGLNTHTRSTAAGLVSQLVQVGVQMATTVGSAGIHSATSVMGLTSDIPAQTA